MKGFYTYFIILFLLTGSSAIAQTKYFLHTLQSGETLSALAKKYNTTVSNIMLLNDMHPDSKLVYGSQIKISGVDKIPAVPAFQEATIEDSLDNQPAVVTHKIAQGETLFSISKQYNVSVDDLKKWNKLTRNSLVVGTVLSIGEMKPLSKIPVPDSLLTKINASAKDETEEQALPETLDKKTKRKKETPQPVINDFPVLTYSGRGFFEKEYHTAARKNAEGIAMVFKTQAGWADGHFYILMNEADPGTVVKIEAANGKTIYAKVLMGMEDIKENNGIAYRISNAAAAALGMADAKFTIFVHW